jgi:hypothetical protein
LVLIYQLLHTTFGALALPPERIAEIYGHILHRCASFHACWEKQKNLITKIINDNPAGNKFAASALTNEAAGAHETCIVLMPKTMNRLIPNSLAILPRRFFIPRAAATGIQAVIHRENVVPDG